MVLAIRQSLSRWVRALTALVAMGLHLGVQAEPLRGIAFTEVTFTDSFWAPRIETNRLATIPHLLRELDRQGSLDGFRLLAGDNSVSYHGYMWGDSDVYKTLQGMTAALLLHPDPSLSEKRDRIIGSIAAAQAPDGYLFPYLQIAEPNYRPFAEETTRTCESYSMGHLIESAAEHFRLTGRTNYLAVACKAADLLRRVTIQVFLI